MGELDRIDNNLIPFLNLHLRMLSHDGHAQKTSQPCPVCKGSGFTRADAWPGDPRFGKRQECVCTLARQRAEQQDRLLERSGILGMSKYADACFANFSQVKGTRVAYQRARDYALDPTTGWLVLVGPCGCGKTHLGVSIAKERIEAGDTVLVQTVPDLLDNLRATYDKKSTETFAALFDEMKQVELLILDDWCAQSITEWGKEKLFQLLNYRYNKNLATVITSNSLQGTDPRILSRMTEHTIVEMDAADYRARPK